MSHMFGKSLLLMQIDCVHACQGGGVGLPTWYQQWKTWHIMVEFKATYQPCTKEFALGYHGTIRATLNWRSKSMVA